MRFNNKDGWRRYIGPRRLLLFMLLFGGVCYAWNLYHHGELSPHLIDRYKDDHPFQAVMLFIFLYAFSIIAALPTLPLNLAGGYFWGGLLGGIYSATAVTLGGFASFCVARWLVGQPLAQHFENTWAVKVKQEFERSGWKFIAFARMNPIIPTGPLNYLLGLTSLSTFSFLWTTFIFLLPPSIMVSFVGESFGTFVKDHADVDSVVRTILYLSAAVTLLASLKLAARLIHTEARSNENNVARDDPERSGRHESYHAKDRSVVG